MVKSGRKVAFFDRNGSDLTSYVLCLIQWLRIGAIIGTVVTHKLMVIGYVFRGFLCELMGYDDILRTLTR
jgi:hypothetical protein